MRISRKQKVLCTPGIRGVVAATMGPGSSHDLGPIHRRTSFFQSVEHYLGCRTCISCKTHAGRFIYSPLFCVKGILDKKQFEQDHCQQNWNKRKAGTNGKYYLHYGKTAVGPVYIAPFSFENDMEMLSYENGIV